MSVDPFLIDEAPAGAKLDLLSLVRKAWRRRWLFFVPFVICLAMAGVAIKVMTPIYESAGQIRVIHDANPSRLIQDGSQRYLRPQQLDEESLTEIWTIVTAPRFLERVALQAQLAAGLAPTTEPGAVTENSAGVSTLSPSARRLRGALRVRQDGTHIFEIAVRHVDPQVAVGLARLVLENYLEEERATRVVPKTTTRDFLENQRKTYREELARAERELGDFQRSIVNTALAGNPINAANLAAVDANVSRLQQELRSPETQAPATAALLGDPTIAAVVPRLGDLEYARLLQVDPGLAPATENELGLERVRLSNALDAHLQARLPNIGVVERSRLAQTAYQTLYRQAQGGAAEKVAGHIAAYRQFAARQPEQSARLTELQLDVGRRQEQLAALDKEISQQNLNLEASISEIGYRIEVRRDPALPVNPAEPDKKKLSLMGVGLSLAIGLALVMLSILLDRSFTDVEHIERVLRLPVIGTLPIIYDRHFQRQRQLRVLRWFLLVLAIIAVASVFTFYLYPRLS